MAFTDRHDAGRRLADELARRRLDTPVMIALPRGGVPVAAQVAARLNAPLDVLVVRKLGCPWQSELGFGAIGEGGIRTLNHELVTRLGLSAEQIDAITAREQAELERRVRRYREGRPPVPVRGRVAILVDDGLATGFTARAAIAVLRHQGAANVVLAIPVAPPATVAELRAVADDVVCLRTPTRFLALGQFYDDFRQTSDEEVAALLAAHSDAVASADTDAATYP
jgi:putative phosphoribosyl transferase